MAQFYTDLAGYPTGSFPQSGADWTTEYTADGSQPYEIVEDSSYTGGKYLQVLVSGDFNDSAVAWDSKDGANVELVARGNNFVNNTVLALRGSGSSGSNTLYGASFDQGSSGSNARIFKYVSDSFTELATGELLNVISGADVFVRFRANGNDLRLKVWESGEGEPTAWGIETTDPDISTGWTGFFGQAAFSSSQANVDAVGVGTEGDTAPTEPVDEGEDQAASLSSQDTDQSTVAGSRGSTASITVSDADQSTVAGTRATAAATLSQDADAGAVAGDRQVGGALTGQDADRATTAGVRGALATVDVGDADRATVAGLRDAVAILSALDADRATLAGITAAVGVASLIARDGDAATVEGTRHAPASINGQDADQSIIAGDLGAVAIGSLSVSDADQAQVAGTRGVASVVEPGADADEGTVAGTRGVVATPSATDADRSTAVGTREVVAVPIASDADVASVAGHRYVGAVVEAQDADRAALEGQGLVGGADPAIHTVHLLGDFAVTRSIDGTWSVVRTLKGEIDE